MADGDEKPARKQECGRRYGNGASVWPKRGTTKENWAPNPNGKKEFGPATNRQGHSGATSIADGNKAAARRFNDEEMLSIALNTLADVMQNGRVENARVAAASYSVSKIDGAPVAKNLNVNADVIGPEEQRAIRNRVLGRFSRLAPPEGT